MLNIFKVNKKVEHPFRIMFEHNFYYSEISLNDIQYLYVINLDDKLTFSKFEQ